MKSVKQETQLACITHLILWKWLLL